MARVTNAELMAELKALREDVVEVKEQVKEMNGRQRDLTNRVTAVETRQSLWAAGLGGLAVVASAIAAWLGIDR